MQEFKLLNLFGIYGALWKENQFHTRKYTNHKKTEE